MICPHCSGGDEEPLGRDEDPRQLEMLTEVRDLMLDLRDRIELEQTPVTSLAQMAAVLGVSVRTVTRRNAELPAGSRLPVSDGGQTRVWFASPSDCRAWWSRQHRPGEVPLEGQGAQRG